MVVWNSIALLHLSEGDIEVPLRIRQILLPDFDSKSKTTVRGDLIHSGRRNGILNDLNRSIEDVEVESIDDHAGKPHYYGDNDC